MKKIIDWVKIPKLPIQICWLIGHDGPCRLRWARVSVIIGAIMLVVWYS